MQDFEPEVWRLVETFAASDIEYLQVKTDDFELVLSRSDENVEHRPRVVEPPSARQPIASEDRGPAGGGASVAAAPELTAVPEPSDATGASTKSGGTPVSETDPADESETVVVPSPSVGIVYHAPSPDAAPYVAVGSMVEPGATIALIEAMKVFTAVSAGVSGTIAEILVENNAFVEYGQPLFSIRTAAPEASV